jgi:hypothetical protein
MMIANATAKKMKIMGSRVCANTMAPKISAAAPTIGQIQVG